MTRSIFILLFIILYGYIISQNISDSLKPFVYYDNTGKKVSEGFIRNGKPDGYWKNYYPNGNIMSEGNRKNYLLDSTWIFYDSTGNIVSMINYKNGKKNGIKKDFMSDIVIEENYVDDKKEGIAKVFYKNGKIKLIKHYKNDVEEGLYKEYDTDGNLITIAKYRNGIMTERQTFNRYDKQGLKQGLWKEFYPNDVVKREMFYTNNKLNGFVKTYDSLGNIISIEKYDMGVLVIDVPEIAKHEIKYDYNDDGRIKYSCSYKDSLKDGIERFFDDNGNVLKSNIYKNGILLATGIVDKSGMKQGNWIEYYETGEKRSEGTYHNDNKIGKWKYYYKNNSLLQEGEYNNDGKFEGKWVWYYENGKILRTENYHNGYEEGESIEYDTIGNVVLKGNYTKGLKNGEWFYQLGNYIEKGKYVDGQKDSIWTTYYKNTEKIRAIGEYSYGDPIGKHICYDENGNVIEEGFYESGKKNGLWKKYDNDTKLKVTIYYIDDEEKKIDNQDIEEKLKKIINK